MNRPDPSVALQEINTLERQIFEADETADEHLWTQAALVVAQLDGDMTQRELAAQWINARTGEAYSQSHVRNVVAVISEYLDTQPRPRFRDAYNEIAHRRTRLQPAYVATSASVDGENWRIECGDAWHLASTTPDHPAQAIVTSPPYWRQRVYAQAEEFGQETVTEYVRKLVDLFDGLKRWLRPDGAAWINLGDSYAGDQLQAIPARFMVAMIDAGWQFRSEVIYERLNLTPRPARKRPTRAHEHVLLFTLSDAYLYDEDYMREPAKYAGYEFERTGPRVDDTRLRMDGTTTVAETRNLRSVRQGSTGWNGTIQHPALMPKLMAERCVLSISRPGDWILDPFCGAATTGLVALRGGRSFLGWEINGRYVATAKKRLSAEMPLLRHEVTA
jgi:DNA modification methylase